MAHTHTERKKYANSKYGPSYDQKLLGKLRARRTLKAWAITRACHHEIGTKATSVKLELLPPQQSHKVKVKTFPGKQRLKGFIITRHPYKKMIKEHFKLKQRDTTLSQSHVKI